MNTFPAHPFPVSGIRNPKSPRPPLLYRLFPGLYRLRTRCSYCRHIISDRGPFASDDKESSGVCLACKSNSRRREHFRAAKKS